MIGPIPSLKPVGADHPQPNPQLQLVPHHSNTSKAAALHSIFLDQYIILNLKSLEEVPNWRGRGTLFEAFEIFCID